MAAPGVAGSAPKSAEEKTALEQGFLDPPESARPWVYGMMMEGNQTREGITADLEALHRVGIRGMMYFEVDQFVPKGPVRTLSPEWHEMIQHLLKEATRLGITIDLNNDGGYAGSGGPWITPELSMQILVWSETRVAGPGRIEHPLCQPKMVRNFYRDIAVLAFPTPAGEKVRMADCFPRMTYSLDPQPFDFAPLIDGDPATLAVLPPVEEGAAQVLNIEFPAPFEAQSFTLALEPWNSEVSGQIEVSDDGRNFSPICPFTIRWPASSVNFPKISSRHYRITMKGPSEDVDWYFRTFAKGFPISHVELHREPRIEDIPGKASYIRQETFAGEPASSPDSSIPRHHILDISKHMDANGRLAWDAPAGDWTVLRIGHTSTGKMNHPAPEGSLGLECDKLSKKALEVHFDEYVGEFVRNQKAAGASALKLTHIDSWETGAQNWTPGFREEFEKRRGYDPLPYFVTLTGRPVESRDVSERFLWDLRRTVADMLLENYAGFLRELSHRHGLQLSIEPYGGGPFADAQFGGQADVPMCEFWTGMPFWWDFLMGWCKSVASSAHLYGSKVLMAESFTAEPVGARWQNHPYQLKALGDLGFTLGINRIVFHRYAMQPWLDRKPGMTMGAFGIHHERTNTWWEQSRAWNDYLSRCQFLLQQGQFVADVAYLGSEGSPHSFPKRENMQPAIPPGYDFDDIPPEVLLARATVRDGRLEFPTGMSYRVLVLPPARTMTPALLRKIRDLVAEGLTLVGPPPTNSPSLTDYPRADAELQRLAADLWGACDGVAVTENRVGKGKVVWGKTLLDVLAGLGAPADFACRDATVGEHIRYIHRAGDGNNIYFVANALPEARRFQCSFRVTGKRPELWWPDTGRIEPVTVYDERDGSTIIPLSFDPSGSVFVIFRSAPPLRDRVVSVRKNNVEISGVTRVQFLEHQLEHELGHITMSEGGQIECRMEIAQPGEYHIKTARGRALAANVAPFPSRIDIEGPWQLEFPAGWGAPERVTLDRLMSWPDHPDPGVRYFSGTAAYRRKFQVSNGLLEKDLRLYLDLGRVAVIAEVKVNGHDLGILWKPPFRADFTNVARVGANDLEIRVVNLWPNRLIGDEQLPEDCEWHPPGTPRNLTPRTWGSVLERWPEWLLAGKSSPTGRHTFTTWKHWTKDDPLLQSGLLGPVTIHVTRVVPLL